MNVITKGTRPHRFRVEQQLKSSTYSDKKAGAGRRISKVQIDYRLVNKWYAAWQDAQKSGDTSIEKMIIPGFARVRFNFQPDKTKPPVTQFPCLPIRHEKYGLLYVLEGETTATATEIILAMDVGAKIEPLTSVELPIVRDERGEPVRFVMNHLAYLTKERNRYKEVKENEENYDECQVKEKLVKEFMNSFYGKFSQAITPRNVFNPSKGEMKPLGKSELTEPCTAALVTSLPRAALSATLIGIERFNKKHEDKKKQITVISATTDGLLIGIPATAELHDVKRFYKYKDGTPKMNKNADKVLLPVLKKLHCSAVMDEINNFLSVKQMRNSRKEMTAGNNEIFEIKHYADQVISVKTRGQIGLLDSGHTSLLARFNHKPPLSEIYEDPEEYKRIMEAGGVTRDTADSKWLIGHLDRIRNGLETIEKYTFITLTSFHKIYKSKGTMDLTMRVSKRRINMDFDWKRKLEEDEHFPNRISPFTVPHTNTSEMFRHRNQMESIRRTGFVARPETVLHRVKIQGRTLRFRWGEPETVVRSLIRGVVQEKIPVTGKMLTYQVMAEKFNTIWKTHASNYKKEEWTEGDFKNATANRGAKWEPGCLLYNSKLGDLVESLAIAINVDPVVAREAVFAVEEFEVAHTRLIGQVISATAHAYKMGIEPFVTLDKSGKLPDLQRIHDTFRQRMSEEEIECYIISKFIPGQLQSGAVKKLKKLFYSLGISQPQAEECAKTIAPATPIKKMRKTPGEKKCTDHFTLALLQADISLDAADMKGWWTKLRKFGLTRNRYFELKKSGNFQPNCVSDTATNKQQIRAMAKAMKLDPTPLLKVIIST